MQNKQRKDHLVLRWVWNWFQSSPHSGLLKYFWFLSLPGPYPAVFYSAVQLSLLDLGVGNLLSLKLWGILPSDQRCLRPVGVANINTIIIIWVELMHNAVIQCVFQISLLPNGSSVIPSTTHSVCLFLHLVCGSLCVCVGWVYALPPGVIVLVSSPPQCLQPLLAVGGFSPQINWSSQRSENLTLFEPHSVAVGFPLSCQNYLEFPSFSIIFQHLKKKWRNT